MTPTCCFLLVALLLLALASTPVAADVYLGNLTCDESQGRFCGNGECLPATGTCQCDPYWSTINDFVTMDGDCSTNVIGIYVLWAVNLAVLTWSYYKSTAIILHRYDAFLETRRARRHGFCNALWHNKGLLGIFLYYGISTPFHFIMSVLHFVQPLTQVGFDILPSVCFLFGKFGFYIMIVLVQGSMLAAALKGNRQHDRLVRGNYAFQLTINTTSVILGMFAFIPMTILQDQPQQQIILMQCYYLIQAVALFGQGVGAMIIVVKVNKALNVGQDLIVAKNKQQQQAAAVTDSSNNNNNTAPAAGTNDSTNGGGGKSRTDKIREKVNDLQRTSYRQAAIQGTIYLLMGAIPFFINKHQYFLPISWLAMPVIGKKLAHQFIIDDSTGAKTVLQRLGVKKTGGSQGTSNTNNNNNLNGMVLHSLASPQNAGPHASNLHTFQSENPLLRQESDKIVRSGGGVKLAHQSSFVSSGNGTGREFEDLLDASHEHHRAFVDFVRAKHAENEVTLLNLTLKYRGIKDSKERAKLGKHMVKDYIDTGAPMQVDLPSQVRDILLSTAKRNQFVPTSYDQIRRTLTFDLKGNFMAQFEKIVDQQQQQQRGGSELKL